MLTLSESIAESYKSCTPDAETVRGYFSKFITIMEDYPFKINDFAEDMFSTNCTRLPNGEWVHNK